MKSRDHENIKYFDMINIYIWETRGKYNFEILEKMSYWKECHIGKNVALEKILIGKNGHWRKNTIGKNGVGKKKLEKVG